MSEHLPSKRPGLTANRLNAIFLDLRVGLGVRKFRLQELAKLLSVSRIDGHQNIIKNRQGEILIQHMLQPGKTYAHSALMTLAYDRHPAGTLARTPLDEVKARQNVAEDPLRRIATCASGSV